MKVLGIVGSNRKHGNTDILVKKVLEGVKSCNIDTELIYLSDYNFKSCIGCEGCSKTYKCVIKDDMSKIYELIDAADGIVVGSPTYFYNVNGLTKSFLDRLYAYEIFDEEDRSVWLSLNEVLGLKYAVTVAICEQEDEADMGFTSIALDKTLSAVGFRVVQSVKALHVFSKGEILENASDLEKSVSAGQKLAKTLLLSQKVKKNY